MSIAQTTTATQPQLPDVQSAYNLITNQVYARAFFDKLAADYGIAPNSEAEARQLLEMGASFQMAMQSEAIKAAEAANSPFASALTDLNSQLSAYGIHAPGSNVKSAATQARDLAIRGQVQQLAGNADIFNAVLALKSAEASEIARQYGFQPQQTAA